MEFSKLEREALLEADGNKGWGLFKPVTTAHLAKRGLFEKQSHISYGMRWRLTDVGKAAVEHIKYGRGSKDG